MRDVVDAGTISVFIPMVFFIAIVAAIGVVMHFRNEREKVRAAGGAEYRKLAEEAVASQKTLLDEVQRMNATLREIERLLREV